VERQKNNIDRNPDYHQNVMGSFVTYVPLFLEFCGKKQLSSFSVILLTNKQTNIQIESITSLTEEIN